MNLEQLRVSIRATVVYLQSEPPEPTRTALQAHLDALLKEELRALTGQAPEGSDEQDRVIAEAYQVVGQLLQDAGLFDSTRGTKILDNLAQGRIVRYRGCE